MKLNLFRPQTPLVGIGQGRDGSMLASKHDGGEGRRIVRRRHPDWMEHEIPWRRLLDSFEGGDRYRNAVYGPDRRGFPCRNLFRHPREYPDPAKFPSMGPGFPSTLAPNNLATDITMYGEFPGMIGSDPASTANDDQYENRRSTTPVPEFLAEAVEIHLSKVYGKEVDRGSPDGDADDATVETKAKDAQTNPPELVEWWNDVDGRGTDIDDWMRDTIAPLLLVLGNLDVVFDHPKATPGTNVVTLADEKAEGLDRCVASYILPQNMVWWRTNAAGRYVECLVREYADPSDRVDFDEGGKAFDTEGGSPAAKQWRNSYVRYRYWTATESRLYNYDGTEELEPRTPHSFGRVPIVRLIDIKRHRTANVGKSRYQMVSEYQRTYYNIDSELRLNGTLQSSPLLSGPEDYCNADGVVSIGPGYVLPMKKNPETGDYTPWMYVSPPTDPSDSLRKDKQDLRDAIDRRTCQTKPAGVTQGSGAGGGSSTVAQSGVSKQLDATTGHNLCASIALTLQRSEYTMAELAMLVINGTPPTPEELAELSITYPASFDLQSASDISDDLSKFSASGDTVGAMPTTQADSLKAAMRQMQPGQDDATYAIKDGEIDDHVARMGVQKNQDRKMIIQSHSNEMLGGGSTVGGSSDPGGQSGGTAVSGSVGGA
jgi:hypothetical protein